MNIYVYSDESGVFDRAHEKYFVFGGLILLEYSSVNECTARYKKAEKHLISKYGKDIELKASMLDLKDRANLYRSLNKFYKFAVVIDIQNTHASISADKKTKQRYLDYVYKIAVKRRLEKLIDDNLINPDEVKNLSFYVDEHSTATNGKYELAESLEQEFKIGAFNRSFLIFHPPIFPNLQHLSVKYCDSKKNALVRAADIIANRIFYLTRSGKLSTARGINNMHIIGMPYEYVLPK